MNPAHQTSLSFTISWRLLELMSIVLVMPSHHCIFCCPLLLLSSSFPASVSFPMSRLFASGGQSIGASASASVLLVNVQGSFPLGLTGLISLQSKGLSRVFSNTIVKASILQCSAFFYCPALISVWLLGRTIALTIRTFVGQECLCFLMCCLGLSLLLFQGASVF